ncbi:MAG: hypothetical protein P8188_09025 [Gemmatimonadota bacterium]
MINRLRIAALSVALTAVLTVPAALDAQVALANVRVHAEIDAIDRDTRTLILRGPNGGLIERSVPEDMPGFGARRPGDEVTVMFLEQVGIHMRKPGAPLPDLTQINVPAGLVSILRAMETEVTQVDASENAVSLRSRQGPGLEATFRLPAGLALSDFAVGDIIDVAYVIPEVITLESR